MFGIIRIALVQMYVYIIDALINTLLSCKIFNTSSTYCYNLIEKSRYHLLELYNVELFSIPQLSMYILINEIVWNHLNMFKYAGKLYQFYLFW